MFKFLKKTSQTNLGKIVWSFKREFFYAMVVSGIINILMLAPTIYMLQIFDRVMISQSILTLATISLLILFLYLIHGISEWLRSRLIISTGIRIDYALNEPIFRASFLDQLTSTGKSPVQPFSDLNVIRQWLTGAGLFSLLDLPWTPIYIAVMFLLHPWLGWLTIFFMATLMLLAWLTTRVTRDKTDRSEDEERELNKFLYTKLQNSEVIEAHGMVSSFRRQWWDRQIEMLQSQVDATDSQERMSAVSKQLRFFMNSFALGAGAFFVIRGELTLGAMIAASLLMSRALSPIDTLVAGWRSFLLAKKSFVRLEKILSEFPKPLDKKVHSNLNGEIRLQQLIAKSQNRKENILNDISVVFPAGQIYLILGRSGAGKSTLGKSILGIWTEVEGKVFLDDIEIQNFERDALGSWLGYLPQDVELFRGSVSANIARMGEVDSSKVIEVAKLTNIHNFVLSLPQGYDSLLEDRGGNLSGGQRQRIALARALYGNPKIIVLDEPDSNLDQGGNRDLSRAVRSLKQRGSSVFLITHSKSLLDIADRIILMETGTIQFHGTTQEFKARHPILANAQEKNFGLTGPLAD